MTHCAFDDDLLSGSSFALFASYPQRISFRPESIETPSHPCRSIEDPILHLRNLTQPPNRRPCRCGCRCGYHVRSACHGLLHLMLVSPLSALISFSLEIDDTFLQARHDQIPVEWRLTVFLPQKVQVYRACCETSIFLTCLRREAP